MKKLPIFMLVFAFLLTLPSYAKEKEEFTIPDTAAYVLMEARTGEVLLSSAEDEQLPVSSLSKIMLLLIVAEELEAGNISLTDQVPAPTAVAGTPAPVIWLDPGEVMPLSDLVKSVVIASSNDAATALAEYISKDTAEFAELMNRRASELGMKNTFFAECAVWGSRDEKSYSSARDVAIMTAELFRHEIFSEFFSTRLSAVREGTERETQLVNTNKMANWYDGILGGKAGQSQSAGFCNANCAEKGELKLVAVVLGARDEDARVNLTEFLLDSGFADFEFVRPELDAAEFSPVAVNRGVEKTVEAAIASPVGFIAQRGTGNSAIFEYTIDENITAPVEKGQILGKITVRMGDRTVAESDIIAVSAVKELTFLKSLQIMTEKFFRL